MVSHEYIESYTNLTASDLDLLQTYDPLDRQEKPLAKPEFYDYLFVEFLHTLDRETRDAMQRNRSQVDAQRLCEFENQCKETIALWKKAKPVNKIPCHSKLPVEIWSTILEHLCDDFKFDDVRGPSVVARELCNASKVSRELHSASLTAFQKLSKLCNKVEMEAEWQGLLSDPWDENLTSDQSILAILQKERIRPFGSRAARICILYEAAGLQRPSRLPARLILTVIEEKRGFSVFQNLPAIEVLRDCQSDFQARIKILKLGIPSLQVFDTLCTEAEKYAIHDRNAAALETKHEQLRRQIVEIEVDVRIEEQCAHKADVELLTYEEDLNIDREMFMESVREKMLRKNRKKNGNHFSGNSSTSFSHLLTIYDHSKSLKEA